jgi:hypothetical protein
VGVTWAVRLWPRSTWPFLPGEHETTHEVTICDDNSAIVYIGDRMLAEQYLALVPVLALMHPWGMEAHAGRAKLVMVMPVVEVEVN